MQSFAKNPAVEKANGEWTESTDVSDDGQYVHDLTLKY
jgi:hypothetical protein